MTWPGVPWRGIQVGGGEYHRTRSTSPRHSPMVHRLVGGGIPDHLGGRRPCDAIGLVQFFRCRGRAGRVGAGSSLAGLASTAAAGTLAASGHACFGGDRLRGVGRSATLDHRLVAGINADFCRRNTRPRNARLNQLGTALSTPLLASPSANPPLAVHVWGNYRVDPMLDTSRQANLGNQLTANLGVQL